MEQSMKSAYARSEMDADSNHGGKERIMFLPVNHEPMQTVIIEKHIVNAFV